jgi:hypothetical protein
MSYKTYADKLGQVLRACKVQNINANIKKLQVDIKRGIDKDFIINNLDCYV